MNETSDLLERVGERFTFPDDMFEGLERRHVRKRRNKRIAAGIVGIAVFVAAVWIVTTGGPFNRTQQPAIQPTPSPTAIPGYHHNGEILVLKDGAFTQIDPVTGNVVTGNGVELPVTHPVSDFAWSPDGMDLAYATQGHVEVADVATGASREIMRCQTLWCSLAWSPDGSRIAVAHDGMLELIDPEGGNRSTLVELPGIDHPTWSPDGERIAFQVISDGRSLYVIDRDGSNLTDLLGPAPHDSIGFFDPAWSPDGSRIAYIASTQRNPVHGLRLRVEVVDADGSNPTELVEAGTCGCISFTPGLTWSPDGTSMALITGSLDELSGSPEAYGLYVMNADGTGLRLVAGSGANGSPAWRPVP